MEAYWLENYSLFEIKPIIILIDKINSQKKCIVHKMDFHNKTYLRYSLLPL